MVGNNRLHINHATMGIIVQEWINRELKAKPKVKSISTIDSMFVVHLTDNDDTATATTA